jgi:vacuolar-type H+-ATPase subunit E/Vma4
MEELQSTEILDREILEDARRKAQRILKTADEEAAVSSAAWEKKTEKALAELNRRFEERLELGRAEIMAHLPLDSRRLALERIDRLLHRAANAYLESLDREKLLGILARELCERAAEIDDGEGEDSGRFKPALKVSYCFLSREEVEGLLGKAFPGCVFALEEGNAAYLNTGAFPGIVADSGAVRISVSAGAVVETLLSEKRGELAAALLGEEALDA